MKKYRDVHDQCWPCDICEPAAKVKAKPQTIAEFKASEANARLIAAAPELLEALQAYERGWRDFVRENPNVNMGAFTQSLTMAAQAIAKAEGRE